ncbi:MAG: sel1 repeat family protein [Proteobacteria bacterium]|nr:sel1 repeat family protein [Pseudomonadota bacterium]
MKKLFALLILCASFFASMPAFADFVDGWDAAYEGDYATAVSEWKPLAEQGDLWAQVFLAGMYRDGLAVPQSSKEAVKWYRISAEHGNALAQSFMGEMYALGHGVPQNFIIAHMWHNLSVSNAEPSIIELAEIVGEKNVDTPTGAKNSMIELRDKVAEKMTSEQIEKAQDLALECVKKDYKGC